jgi:hypothetical protein
MRTILQVSRVAAVLLCLTASDRHEAEARPFINGRFHGRIAYSCDGNHNDPDDWIASPVALAILAKAGLKDRLVHFDYNCILPQTNPEWEKIHAESVLGAAERYGFDKALFFDCRRNRDAAVASIAEAINHSSADNPLYLIIAGPMEVPYQGIQRSDPARRQYVYCLSHSRWNDGFASSYKFTFTKRSVIEQDVHWVQIGDQNRLLSFGRYGQPATPPEFKPYFWMRDSNDANVRWLWERMVVSTRPDPSDAGMTWFLVTGDEECDPAKLKGLIEDSNRRAPVVERRQVRLEAENFRHLEGFALEDRNDRNASHRLSIKFDGNSAASVRTRLDEPFTGDAGHYDLHIRHLVEPGAQALWRFLVNGKSAGGEWRASNSGGQWVTHTIPGAPIRRGDELTVEVTAGGHGHRQTRLCATRAGSGGACSCKSGRRFRSFFYGSNWLPTRESLSDRGRIWRQRSRRPGWTSHGGDQPRRFGSGKSAGCDGNFRSTHRRLPGQRHHHFEERDPRENLLPHGRRANLARRRANQRERATGRRLGRLVRKRRPQHHCSTLARADGRQLETRRRQQPFVLRDSRTWSARRNFRSLLRLLGFRHATGLVWVLPRSSHVSMVPDRRMLYGPAHRREPRAEEHHAAPQPLREPRFANSVDAARGGVRFR